MRAAENLVLAGISLQFSNVIQQINYEGCNFNSGNYLFTTDTK